MPAVATDPGGPSPFLRLAALVRVTMPALRTGWVSRSGRYYAWSIALFYGALAAYSTAKGESASAVGLVALALTWISGAAGIVAYAAARDVDTDERGLGLDRLVRSRAVPRRFVEPARLLATMAVVGSSVLFPGLLVVLLALVFSPTSRAAGSALLLAFLVVLYALAFGVVFGAVARGSAALGHRFSRGVFSLVVFGPLGLALLFGSAPSLFGAFAWLVARIRELGGYG